VQSEVSEKDAVHRASRHRRRGRRAGPDGAERSKIPFPPGVTVKDEHPQGCVDCRVSIPNGDYRLNAELAKVSDHPKIDAVLKTVPTDCLMCHKQGTKEGPLTFITHRVHYRKPKDNVFITVYQGVCLNCHAVNAETEAMVVKSGPKNW
jgi:hypothetical protein